MITEDVYVGILEHFPENINIECYEANIDECPLFLLNDSVSCINDQNRYVSKLISLCEGFDREHDGVWRLLSAVSDEDVVQKEWGKVTTRGTLQAWQKFVIACDYTEGFDAIFPYSDSDILKASAYSTLQAYNIVRYIPTIYSKVSSIKIVETSPASFLKSFRPQVMFLDCTREDVPQDCIENYNEAIMVASPSGTYRLEDWDCVTIDKIDIHNNFQQVVNNNGISGA